MGVRITRIINDELIDIREFAKPNACFQTNEYPDSYDFCILHEQFNPYDLINDNKIKDKELARLNKIIDELEKGLIYTLEYIIDIDKITIKEYNAIYKKATNIDYDFHISFEENIRRLQELKEEGK